MPNPASLILTTTNQRRVGTHGLVDPEDGVDVHEGINVAAAVNGQRVEDDAVFGDEVGGLTGGAESVGHDIVGENVEFPLLLAALDVSLAGEADAADDACISEGDRCTIMCADVGGNGFGGELDGGKQKVEVPIRFCAKVELLGEDMPAYAFLSARTWNGE
ncbi:hypothetical protein BV25DRAFT_1897817 [Artomyces pyxidatus]|uniref:Uncharacterized protein n=1 Tax=Artomyces pyxidatus TaxID=48021 RepID=A0ACB8TBY7_9AGAM|nr:hypothetical protein BV25DRAFT_1897817 [Artomyces pyxidatus]